MTRQQRYSESLKSISGGTLVGLGLHILSGNLNGAVIHFRHLLGVPAGETFGVLPSAALAASQAAKAYALDHQSFMDSLAQLLASCWPLLLIVIGAMLLRDALTDKVKVAPGNRFFGNEYFHNPNPGCRFRCPSFDV